MTMRPASLTVAWLFSCLAVPALAHAPDPTAQRLRGSIVAVDAGSVTLHTRDGRDVKIATDPATHYLSVVKSDLTKVAPGSFIGTATKGAGSRMVALEVVVFPPAMKGTGEGHYAWDRLPDTSGAGGEVASTMTNGTVGAAGSAAPAVSTSMTNGTVDAAADQAGAKQITVSYKGGQKKITVPAGAPVVGFVPADRTIVVKGAAAFVVAGGPDDHLTAQAVAVGANGITPPM